MSLISVCIFICAPHAVMVHASASTASAESSAVPSARSTAIADLESRRQELHNPTETTYEELSAILRRLCEAYADQSDFEKALQAAEQDILLRSQFGPDGLPESWLLIGDLFRRQGYYRQSKRFVELAIKALDADSAGSSASSASRRSAAYNYLALVENNCGQFSKSESSARKALALAQEANSGAETVAMHEVVLANALRQQGKFDEAVGYLENAVSSLKKSGTAANQGLLGTATNNLGAAFFWRGDYQTALKTLQEGLRIRISAQGSEHPDVANSYIDLACTELRLGMSAEALTHAQSALRIRMQKLGKAHPDSLAAMSVLAVIYQSSGTAADTEAAASLLKEAVANGRITLGAMHPDLAQYADDYANVLAAQKLYARSVAMQARSLAIRKRVFGTGSREYAGGLRSLAQIETLAGRPSAAKTLLLRSARIYKANGRSPDQDYADTLDALAEFYVGKKQLQAAQDVLLQAVEARRSGGATVAYAVTCANLAEILEALGRHDESQSALTQAKSIVDALPTSQRSHEDCAAIVTRYQKLCGSPTEKP